MANQMSNQNDNGPKETSPNITAGLPTENDILTRRYDLVEQLQFLYVRVLKARHLPPPVTHPYIEVNLGNYKGTTRFFHNNITPFPPVWNQVFAFEKDRIQDLNLELVLKDNALPQPHSFVGRVRFLISDVPKRVPPESPLAPQWYKLEDQSGALLETGDLMLAVWMGSQADEFFPQAWFSDATSISGHAVALTRSKIYISPTMWYLRVNVIQAQDLLLRFHPQSSELFVQVDLGHLRLRTSFSKKKDPNPMWNEDLMFVAQEPFNESLVISVEQGSLGEHVSLGKCVIPLKNVDKRLDGGGVSSRWYNLDMPGIIETAQDQVKFASKFNARISLDGAYHVLDEPTEYSSDFRASAKKLWKPSIGVLELGILKASGLEPMKKETRTHAYCVAKYGPKWVRTRTVVDSLSPVWNEQYIWEVYDPFTVITIAVFNNNHLDAQDRARGAMDTLMGKIRIRLSTLDRSKIYTHSYPLICLQPSGVKKMGEIHLALRFSWPFWSSLNVYQFYIVPLFPRQHYVLPLSSVQLDNLRNQTAYVTWLRLSKAEPPLAKEVVYNIMDVRSDTWSMRKGQANLKRVKNLVGWLVSLWKWLEDIQYWKNPITTCLFHFLCILVLVIPEPILPLGILYLVFVGLKNFFKRPRHPPHIDADLSCADTTNPEDLEEEFDLFPSQFGGQGLRKRYDRLRGIGGSAQRMANDLATIGERLKCLSSWRDPRATTLFLIFCCVSFLVTVTVPAQLIIFIWITFCLRHPRFRGVLPSIPQNFLKRMPSKHALIL
ncbi:FT-interacting protein 1-like [Senna tora]|uniref:FT-interacting protein 1-like n=1 Tax=Senna tora TaxID=362788 RepID=A0A834SLW7_9FABA|nr:FT-interacting protein 1-like [Senna tora]